MIDFTYTLLASTCGSVTTGRRYSFAHPEDTTEGFTMSNKLSEDSLASPRLPPELEHEIFKAAALHNTGDAYRLLFVAKRTHEW